MVSQIPRDVLNFQVFAASIQKYDQFVRADLVSCVIAEPAQGLILSSAFGWIPKAWHGHLRCVRMQHRVFPPSLEPFIFAYATG